MAQNPLEQFEITTIAPIKIGSIDASFTNSALAMLIVVGLLAVFLIGGTRKAGTVPGRWQTLVELIYGFIGEMLHDNVGDEGKKYFPFIFTLFIFVLGCNLLGMIPYMFTVTSHILVTFALAALVFIGVTIIGFYKNGLGYLKLFLPGGAPVWLLPIIIPVEVLSYLIRPVSLSVRLFANMFAGHMMMKIFAGFVVSMVSAGAIGYIGALLPFAFNIFMTGLEILVAMLQAYVFAILSCIYLRDALHPSH